VRIPIADLTKPAVLILIAGLSAWAQSDRATITGSVTDQSGAVVPGARIRAVEVNTNVERTTEGTGRGDYTMPQLTVGAYRVEVTAPGFKTFVRQNVVLTAGTTVRVDAALSVGEVTESVSVTGEMQALQTDSAKVSTAVTNRFVEDLPLVVGGQLRSPFNLALIAPEAKDTTNFAIGGGQEGGWDLTVDGISATPGAPFDQKLWTMINTPSVDAITEFSMESNGFKAEFGRAGGGMLSFVSKSGTNEFHGTAYEFLRNDKFDANTWFNNALRNPRPILKQSDFGFTMGGPMYIPKTYDGRNKTFFFMSYEGFRNRRGSSSSFRTIPLPEMYQGDFSNWKDARGNLMPIYDPTTTRPDPDNPSKFIRDPFPNAQIPQARFSQISKNVIALATMKPNMPDPSGILNPNPRNNYVVSAGGAIEPWDKMDIKADHNFTVNDRVGFLFHWGQNLLNFLGDEPPGFPVPLNDYRVDDTNTRVYRVTWDHVISPRMLNHFSFGINDWWQMKASYNFDKGWGTKLGLKNTPDPNKNFPGVVMDGYSTWGREEWGGSLNKAWAGSNDVTFTTGAHSLKLGFIYQRDHYNGYGQHTGTGGFTFRRATTSVPGDQTNLNGNGFASMLLGEVSEARIQTLRFVSDQWHYYAGYIQDDWRVNRKLTLNYGVRYEYTPPTTEGHFPDGYSNLDPDLPNPGAGGRPGAMIFAGKGEGRTGQRSMYPAWKWGIGPRLGLAYSLNDKTVIRASGSRSFAPMKNTGGSSHWHGFIGEFSWSTQDGSITHPFNWDSGIPSWPEPPFLVPDFLNRNGVTSNTVYYWQQYDAGRLPEYLNWSFSIQRQLPSNMVAEVNYNATTGHHLTTNMVDMNQTNPAIYEGYVSRMGFDGAYNLMNQNINSAAARAAGVPYPYSGFNGSVQQALRPFPQYGGVNTSSDGGDRSGNSTYHAMVLKLEKRYSNGLQMLSSYVLSKMFSTAEAANASSGGSMDAYNLKLEKSLSQNDQTHVFKFNYSYELPFGRGKKWANQGFGSHIVGGWRVAGVQIYSSGTPRMLSPGYGLRMAGAGNRVMINDYEGWRATPKNEKFDPFVDLWWEPSITNKTPGLTAPSGAKVWVYKEGFGNATLRNPKERSPWNHNENLSVARTFQITERLRADFRWEAFNLLNRVRWGGPDSGMTSNNFGLVRSTANTPRQMQLGLKLYW
jgi:hypothetical protein